MTTHESVEAVGMGYAGNNIIEFHGETHQALSSNRGSYVNVNGVRYDILPNTLSKFKNCSNAKEYVESIEMFAYQVLVAKSISNNEYFSELKTEIKNGKSQGRLRFGIQFCVNTFLIVLLIVFIMLLKNS